MQEQMNLKIKLREGFRPFAPSVLRERVSDYFELDRESPYMLVVAPVCSDRQIPMPAEYKQLSALDRLNLPRSDIPAVTHIDYTARIQTVSRDRNAAYYDLIKEFETITGSGVLVNTSFNVRGEPVVCTPADAYRCFMRTHIDYLVLGPFLLDKESQPEWHEPRPESVVRPKLTPQEGQKFALTVGSGFAVLGLIAWGAGNSGLATLLFGIATVFILAGLVLPGRLTLLHRTWMGLGKAISRITAPIVMSLVYLLIFAPLGGARRLVGRNPLVHSAGIDGYWTGLDPEHNDREKSGTAVLREESGPYGTHTGTLGVHESSQEVVAVASHCRSSAARFASDLLRGIRTRTVYLFAFLSFFSALFAAQTPCSAYV